MTTAIPDLWGYSDVKPEVLTPIAVLRAQASLLSQKTKGLLIGETRISTAAAETEGKETISFDVRAPAANNSRYPLLQVEYASDALYPCTVTGRGLARKEELQITNIIPTFPNTQTVTRTVHNKTAHSDTEFIEIVKEVLQAPTTVALLQTLIAKSNECASESKVEAEEAAEDAVATE